MNSLAEMMTLLVGALRSPTERDVAIKQFQSLVWDWQGDPVSKELYDVLADLAYDLDFFEPDPVRRAQAYTYYGDEGLEQEITTALCRLADLGVDVPSDLPRNE